MKHRIRYTMLLLIFAAAQMPLLAWSLQPGRLMTPWADEVDPANPLPEYPRPQMVRADWLNLNGLWQFEVAAAGDPVPTGRPLPGEILVPFPVESAISGVMQHYERLWYRRTFEVPAAWQGQRLLLHFGAVDWESEVYINGTSVGVHKGGFDGFSYDITPHLTSGPQELIVRVFDPTNSQAIACGKQDLNPNGIWQTVWLEPVPPLSIEKIKLVPDVDNSLLRVTGLVSGAARGLTVQATAYENGQAVGTVSGAPGQPLDLRMRQPKLWSPDAPFLYDLKVTLRQGDSVLDEVDSYFGMRKISLASIDGVQRLMLNDEFVFQMGPLDQGWWPDGLFTAPTDEALKWDLDMTKAFGFNMTRKHVKVEPARWYYWADKLGLLVWQDMPSMRHGPSAQESLQFERELEQMIDEFGNHPSIILWVVFNEGWGQHDTVRMTEKTMDLDPSRLASCASGWTDHPVGHIVDRHAYPAPGLPTLDPARAWVCGEYGGIGLPMPGHLWQEDNWGYTGVSNGDELAALYDVYMQQLAAFRDDPGLSAAVYTQITDVEGETNGLITYDRVVVKADPALIALSNSLNRTYQEQVATSEQAPQTWRYTTTQPAANWNTVGFDDSAWAQGPGGFGTTMTPGAVVGTTWDTGDIWIRRTFNPGDLTPQAIARLVLRIHHDEAAAVYINGVEAISLGGYTTGYGHVSISDEARAAIVPNADNLIAVHCNQTGGGQYIDAGLSLETTQSVEACGRWGYPEADLNRDCKVDFEDLAIAAAEWTGAL